MKLTLNEKLILIDIINREIIDYEDFLDDEDCEVSDEHSYLEEIRAILKKVSDD